MNVGLFINLFILSSLLKDAILKYKIDWCLISISFAQKIDFKENIPEPMERACFYRMF